MSAPGQNEESDSTREAARRQWSERLPWYLCLSFFGSYVLPFLGHFNYVHVSMANHLTCVTVYVFTQKAVASGVYMLFQSTLFLVAFHAERYRFLQCVTAYLLYKNFEWYHIESVPPPIGSLAIPIMFEAFAYFGSEEGVWMCLLMLFMTCASVPPLLLTAFNIRSYSCLWQIPLNFIVLLPIYFGLYVMDNFGKLTPIFLLGSLGATIRSFYMHESIIRRYNL